MYYKIKPATEKFLKHYVYPKLSISVITEYNAENIVNFIVDNFVTPLVNATEDGVKIDEALLNSAEDAITDITSNPLW